MQRTNIINREHFLAALNDFNCGKTPFIEVDAKDFEKLFFEVKPTKDYQTPVNEETGEELPNCCEGHKKLFKDTQDWFNKFPMCCETHQKLSTAKWFKKENYANVALKVVQQVAYTAHHINKQIDSPDWYKEITDYIEYNYQSFGNLPTGYGCAVGLDIYLHQVKCWLEDKNLPIPDEKKKKLSEYVELYYIAPQEEVPSRDLNILYATYQRWLKLFPFEISYFAKVKERFSKQLPFLSEPPVLNKYLGLAKAKLQTQEELSKTLNNITIQLLEQVNTGELLEKGLITDKNKHAIEITNANHRLKQNSLLVKYTKGEIKYVKLLKAWLANEKQYFKEILPMINNTGTNSGPIQENDKVLIRDDYFQIILEIYNLHRDTLDTYLTDKCNKLIFKNPLFVACLYKDINKVMEGVHKEGEPDLLIKNGDFVIEYGDLKLSGNPSIFDDAMTWLWAKLMEGFINNASFKVDTDIKQMQTDFSKVWNDQMDKTTGLIKHFEEEFLKRNDYTPAYAKKIAELNKELKAAKSPEPKTESKEPNTKLKLADITISENAYNSIIGLLIDKGHCQKDTLKWIDGGKGNKGLLIAILKDLRGKAYYKDGINPTNEDYKNIANNTFDWEVAIDTIKKAKPTKFPLNFIPVYSGGR